jgi:peroxiredoxin
MMPNQGQEPNKTRTIVTFLLIGTLAGVLIGWITSTKPASAPGESPSTQTPLLAATVFLGTTSLPTPTGLFVPAQELLVGGPAPDFSLKTLEGKVIRLSSLKGKPVLINLWATWCPPCRDEMSLLEAAYQKHKDQELQILAIDIPEEDSLNDIHTYVVEQKLTFPILLDEGGQVSRGQYAMLGRPSSYFIDRKGILRRIQVGEITPDKMDTYLADILSKPNP